MSAKTTTPTALSVLSVIAALLLVSLFLRIGKTYFTPDRHLTVPDFYFARDKIGRDFEEGGFLQAVRLANGTYKTQDTYYGPAFAAALATTFPFAATFNACSMILTESCTAAYYQVFVTASVLLLLLLAKLSIRDRTNKIIAVVFIAAFLLGIPGSRGLETGNIDILLAGVFGLTSWLCLRTAEREHVPDWRLILLGILAGWLANTKIFLAPLIVAAALSSRKPHFTIFGSALSFFGSSLIPRLFGSATTLMDPVNSSAVAFTVFSRNIYTHYPGNNAVTTFSAGLISYFIPDAHPAYTSAATIVSFAVAAAVLLMPFLGVIRPGFTKKTRGLPYSPLAIPGFALCAAAMNVFPPVSFDYRLFYLLSLYIVCLGQFRSAKAVTMIHGAIVLLLVKSLWIEHARLMNLFLYSSCYYAIRGSAEEMMYVISSSVPVRKRGAGQRKRLGQP